MSSEVALREGHVPALVEEPALLASRAPDPVAAIEFASKCAALLKDVLRAQKLITVISRKEHVNAEGWTLLAAMTGYSPRVAWSRKVDPEIGDGWEASVELVDGFGQVVAAAEAMALKGEGAQWGKHEYSVRSMAMTRATSRAIRLKLGYIVHMAGYSATAAEEMPAEGNVPPAGGTMGDPPREPPVQGTSPSAPPAAANQGSAGTASRPAPAGPPKPLSPGKAEFVALMEELGIRNTHPNRTRAIEALQAHKLTSDDLVKPAERRRAEKALRVAFGVKEKARVVVEVESASEPGKNHEVTLHRLGEDVSGVCKCEWAQWHADCRHIPEAWRKLALSWNGDQPIGLEREWDGIDIAAVAQEADERYEDAKAKTRGEPAGDAA